MWTVSVNPALLRATVEVGGKQPDGAGAEQAKKRAKAAVGRAPIHRRIRKIWRLPAPVPDGGNAHFGTIDADPAAQFHSHLFIVRTRHRTLGGGP